MRTSPKNPNDPEKVLPVNKLRHLTHGRKAQYQYSSMTWVCFQVERPSCSHFLCDGLFRTDEAVASIFQSICRFQTALFQLISILSMHTLETYKCILSSTSANTVPAYHTFHPKLLRTSRPTASQPTVTYCYPWATLILAISQSAAATFSS